MLAHWRERGFGWRSLLDRATGDWLGFIGLNVVGPVEGVASEEVEIGWWLVRSAWGRGFAREGAEAARDEGFDRVGLNQMIARRDARFAGWRRLEIFSATRQRGSWPPELRCATLDGACAEGVQSDPQAP